MILIRVAQQERVDVKPTIRVARQPFSKHPAHVRSWIVGVVSGATNFDVNQKRSSAFKLDQSHVAIAHREK